ncbi:hypothetical protein VTO42DRAFT_3845 [Malbranchea cinnamomea]
MGSVENPRAQKQQPKKPWVETPLIESRGLSQAVGCRVFLKLENLQPSGSFKSRAVGNLVRAYASDPSDAGKYLHFFIPSAGNAGLAAAMAASALNYPCTVAVPTTTKPVMVSKLQQAGANVIQHGANIVEAASRLREVMDELRGQTVEGNGPIVPIELHPFDHEKIWEGVSTLVDELAYQLPPVEEGEEREEEAGRPRALPVDAIICSVGGGGLMNGIIMGIERQSKMCPKQTLGSSRGGRDVHVIATETTGAASLAESVKTGKLVTIPGITSMATSLGAVRVATKTFENSVSPPPGVKVHSVVLHDSDAARGALRLLDEQKLLVELACGVSVEAAFTTATGVKGVNGCNGLDANGHGPSVQSYLSQVIPNFGPKSRVVIVVCGGSNVSLEMAAEWRRQLDEGWGAEVC